MPSIGIAFGTLGAASFGAGDFVGGLAARRSSVFAVVAGAQLAGLAALLVGAAIIRPPLPGGAGIGLGVLAGLAGAVGLAGLFGGMRRGSMGLVAALSGAGGLAIPVLVGAATGATVGPLQLAGIAAAAAAGVAASGASRGELGRAALGLAIVAALGFGTWYVLLDLAAEAGDPLWILVLSRAASATATGVLGFRSLERGTYPARLVVASGILDVGGNALFVAARGEMAVGVAAALIGLYPVVTMLLARVVLGERLSPIGLAGVALALTAVVLISLGG